MIQFEAGKSYRASNHMVYTVTKRTAVFVTFESADGTDKFRCKPYETAVGFEWVDIRHGFDSIEARDEVKEQPEENEPLRFEALQTQKGSQIMSKITIEQAVSAVQSATTEVEVQAVLEQCKKDQIHEVFLAVTGEKTKLCAKSWKKADLVTRYAWQIMTFKARQAFKAMDAEAKAEYLMSQKYRDDDNSIDDLIWGLSLYDLIALNARLGVCFEEFQDTNDNNSYYHKSSGILSNLRAYIRRTVFFAPASKNPVEAVVTEVKPDYDAAFDETAYVPDYQANSAVLDDVSEVYTPDVQEVNATTYEAMREAHEAYLEAEDKYLTSHKTDKCAKEKSDTAYREYLRLLEKYRQEGKPERESALNWVRDYCEGKSFPMESLRREYFERLSELFHKCGLHAALFKGQISNRDMAVILLREAGIDDNEKTSYEQYVEKRKELQADIHKLWQKRHALRKAQRIFGEGSADAEALSDVWDMYHDQADVLLGEYWRVCEFLEQERECVRRYEADSQLADTLAIAEVAVQNEPEVQTSQLKTAHNTTENPRKPSRKSHMPSCVQHSHVNEKLSRHSPNSKPLMKATRVASSIRIRKF